MATIEERAKLASEGYEDDGYKRFGIRVDKIEQGLSFGACISYDKYMKEYYLFINLIKWCVSIGWLTFERKEE